MQKLSRTREAQALQLLRRASCHPLTAPAHPAQVMDSPLQHQEHSTLFFLPNSPLHSCICANSTTCSPADNHSAYTVLPAPMFLRPPAPGTASSTRTARLHHCLYNTQYRMGQEKTSLAFKDHLRNPQGKGTQAAERSHMELQQCSPWIRSRAASLSISHDISSTPNPPANLLFVLRRGVYQKGSKSVLCSITQNTLRLTEFSLNIILPSPARQAAAPKVAEHIAGEDKSKARCRKPCPAFSYYSNFFLLSLIKKKKNFFWSPETNRNKLHLSKP